MANDTPAASNWANRNTCHADGYHDHSIVTKDQHGAGYEDDDRYCAISLVDTTAVGATMTFARMMATRVMFATTAMVIVKDMFGHDCI